jgi:hypothetical protein
MLGAAAGLGPGSIRRTHYVSVPCDLSGDPCDDSLFGVTSYRPETRTWTSLSVAVEFSLRVRWRVVELGGFVRYETWEDRRFATLGPTLGVGF